jgi:hypothetical protein
MPVSWLIALFMCAALTLYNARVFRALFNGTWSQHPNAAIESRVRYWESAGIVLFNNPVCDLIGKFPMNHIFGVTSSYSGRTRPGREVKPTTFSRSCSILGRFHHFVFWPVLWLQWRVRHSALRPSATSSFSILFQKTFIFFHLRHQFFHRHEFHVLTVDPLNFFPHQRRTDSDDTTEFKRQATEFCRMKKSRYRYCRSIPTRLGEQLNHGVGQERPNRYWITRRIP